ncbi:MAG: hypothetical protein ACJAYU_002444 [Bradymonadia bacterium]
MLLITLLAAPASALERVSELTNGDILLGEEASQPRVEREGAQELLLLAIDSPYQVFDTAGSLISVAAWAPDGRPAAGADVYIADEFIGRTTAEGAFAFRWGVPGNEIQDYWRSGSQVSVVWEDGESTRAGAVWFNAMSRTESFASDHLFVYADRGVLAPGDTLNARVVAWHLAADYEPVDDRAVELLLTGPDGEVTSGIEIRTDEFGTGHASLQLPVSLPEGLYQLNVAYEGATAATSVRVERFVPPAFEVTHDLPRFLQRDAAELQFQLSVDSFDQTPVDSGTITVDLIASGNEVRWSQVQSFDGSGPHAWNLGDDELAAWTEDIADRAALAVRLTVEDQDGRVSQITRDLTYAINPYIAVIEADRDAWSTGDQAQLIARVTDVERVPLRNTELRLVSSNGVTLRETTDDSGTVQFSLEMGDRGFDVELFAPNVDAPIARHTLTWQSPQPMRSLIEDAIVRENESTSVRVTFPSDFVPVEGFVHMDVTDVSGSVVNAVLLKIEEADGEYVATGEFSAPSWGSMLLTFFCLGTADEMERAGRDAGPSSLGLLTEGQNLVVHPGRELQIELTGAVESIAPGASFDASIVVRNVDGDRIDAALGVSLVDAALVSLKDPLEITPMDHFYNPELRTISTTGSAILTWPVVSRNWGGETHDIALPPFDFKPGGSVAIGRLGGQTDDSNSFDAEESPTSTGGFANGSAGNQAMEMPMMMAAPPEMEPTEQFQPQASLSRREQDQEQEGGAEPIIEIRFETPETAFWDPSLRAVRGHAELRFDAPDSIAPHVLTVVASDANGGVTVFRQMVEVTQPLSVSAQIPAGLALGETAFVTATVSNRTDGDVAGVVSIESDSLETDGSVDVLVPAGASTTVALMVTVAAAGSSEATIIFDGDGAADAVQIPVFAAPRGVPSARVVAGEWDGDRWTALVPQSAGFRHVGLRVTFPAVTPGFVGADKLINRMETEPVDRLAFDLTTAILLLPHRSDAAAWREKIQISLDRIVSHQQDNGGWHPWWSAAGSPQLTTWLLESLVEARANDFVVPSEAIEISVDYLLDALEAQYDVSAFAWWEGATAAVIAAARFESMHVLARASSMLSEEQAERLREVAESALEYLESDGPSLLAYAHATGVASHLPRVSAERTLRGVERLVQLGEESHWEPSWFNAYGGVIEATVVTLSVLKAAELPQLDLVRRSAARQLMSTASALGDWHNAAGSAWLIRGLALLSAAGETDTVERSLTITVGGEVIVETSVDPRDPFLSTASLALVDLAEYLADGSEVIVTFDGDLKPAISLVETNWLEPAAVANVAIVLEQSQDGPLLRITHELGPANVSVWLPPHVRIDRAAAAAGAGELVGWSEHANGELRVATVSDATIVPLRTVLAGDGALRGAWINPLGQAATACPGTGRLTFVR